MGKVFPRIYDGAMAPLETLRFKKIRAALAGKADGRVLEIGSGTGLNFPYYKNGVHVDAIEPNPYMMRRTDKRIKAASASISTHLTSAESLPFADDTFDTVVATLVFCTIPDPVKALEEIERVSKPGAKFLLFEHVRLDRKGLGKTQDMLTPLWKKMCDGCHLNRDTLKLLAHSNFTVSQVVAYSGGLFLAIECLNNKN